LVNVSINSGGSTKPKSNLHIAETLHQRKLTVHVSGPSSGAVTVRYTARYHGKLIATHSKIATLRHDKLVVVFTLPARAAAHARIQVSARLGRNAPITNTVRRRQ
jgi:hypothetical protein